MVYWGSMQSEGTLRTEQSPDIININVNLKWLTNRTAHMPGNKKNKLTEIVYILYHRNIRIHQFIVKPNS